MKKHWKEAPERIRKMVEDSDKHANRARLPTRAEAWMAVADRAFGLGYDLDAPETPHLDALEKARESGEPGEATHLHHDHGLEIEAEARARNRWRSMRRWAAEPSAEEEAETARRQREALAHERAIEARAQEILAAEESKRADAARKRARAEAEKEAVR